MRVNTDLVVQLRGMRVSVRVGMNLVNDECMVRVRQMLSGLAGQGGQRRT